MVVNIANCFAPMVSLWPSPAENSDNVDGSLSASKKYPISNQYMPHLYGYAARIVYSVQIWSLKYSPMWKWVLYAKYLIGLQVGMDRIWNWPDIRGKFLGQIHDIRQRPVTEFDIQPEAEDPEHWNISLNKFTKKIDPNSNYEKVW